QGPPHEHMLEMGHHQVGVVYLLVEGDRGHHDPGDTADDEEEDEAEHEEERDAEPGTAGPDGRNPTENLDSARDVEHHAGAAEKTLPQLGHPGGEHVVLPESETDKA